MNKNIKGFVAFLADYYKFRKLAKKNNIKITGFNPILKDRYSNAGEIDAHYFIQDINMAKKVIASNTDKHYDIGSRIDGFISHLLSSNRMTVTMLDIRPLPVKIDNLDFIQTDATSLSEIADNSISSISSLHAIEHFGLGRYGDSVDPMACYKAMKSIQRVLAKEGFLYFSVPIAQNDEVWFNGQRKFSPITIINTFNELELIEFSILSNYKVTVYDRAKVLDMLKNKEIHIGNFDCGMFIFKKS